MSIFLYITKVINVPLIDNLQIVPPLLNSKNSIGSPLKKKKLIVHYLY